MTVYCECETCKYNDNYTCSNFNGIVYLDDDGNCESRIEKDDNNESE